MIYPKTTTRNISNANIFTRVRLRIFSTSIRQQTKSNDEGLAKILAEQKMMTDGFSTMKDIVTKLNALQAGEIKQKVRLRDLQDKEISALQKKNELTAAEAKAIIANLDNQDSFGDNNKFKYEAEAVIFNEANPFGELSTYYVPPINHVYADDITTKADSTTITADEQ